MSTVYLLAIMGVLALLVGIALIRVSAGKVQEARQDRLKAHLNWVSPEPPGSRRRRRPLLR
jgi:hypothetical protein